MNILLISKWRASCPVLTLLIFLSTPCFGSQWIILKTDDRSTFSVDVSSIARTADGHKKAWFLLLGKNDQPLMGADSDMDHRVTRVMTLQFANCKTRQIGMKTVLAYGAGRDQIDSSSHKIDIVKYAEAAPDTISEVALEYLCPQK